MFSRLFVLLKKKTVGLTFAILLFTVDRRYDCGYLNNDPDTGAAGCRP